MGPTWRFWLDGLPVQPSAEPVGVAHYKGAAHLLRIGYIGKAAKFHVPKVQVQGVHQIRGGSRSLGDETCISK